MEDEPLISLIFPLYNSSRFIDRIIQNVEAVRYSNVEFLFGDRHGLDDCIEILESKYGHDARFRFFKSNDGEDWRVNTNHLIAQAKGDYYRFMPHDDFFLRCGLREMLQEFVRFPETILVYSPVKHYFNTDPVKKLYGAEKDYATENAIDWDFNWIMRFNYPMKCTGSFRGLVDLKKVRANNVVIENSSAFSDRYYLFGLALIGKFRYSNHGYSEKEIWEGSVSYEWKFIKKSKKPSFLIESYNMHAFYLNKLVSSSFLRIKGKLLIIGHILSFVFSKG